MEVWFSAGVVPGEPDGKTADEPPIVKRVSSDPLAKGKRYCQLLQPGEKTDAPEAPAGLGDATSNSTEPGDGADPGCGSCTRESTADAMHAFNEELQHILSDLASRRSKRWSRGGYFVMCLSSCTVVSAICMGLWSSIGCGIKAVSFLVAHAGYKFVFAGMSVCLTLLLYILDFFCPPHLPNRYMALFKGDYVVGRSMLAIAGVAFFVACLLSANVYPTLPLMITLFLSPLLTLIIRATMRQVDPSSLVSSATTSAMCRQQQADLLELVIGHEQDTRRFYAAATAAFYVTSVVCFVIWLHWILTGPGRDLSNMDVVTSDSKNQKDAVDIGVLYICWVAPMVISCANLLFGFLVHFRLLVSRPYDETDELKSQLHHLRFRPTTEEETDDDAKRRHYRDQKQQYVRQLTNLVKLIGCVLIIMFGTLWVAAELVAADSLIAQMVQGFMGFFFLTFCSIVFVTLKRLTFALKAWLRLSPLWRMAVKLMQWEWTRVVLLCMFMPMIPAILLLSAINQQVRCWRGLYNKVQPCAVVVEEHDGKKLAVPAGDTTQPVSNRRFSAASESVYPSWLALANVESDENPEDSWFTVRVKRYLLVLHKDWDWLSISQKVYIIGGLFILYTLTPRVLNIFLSWLGSFLKHFPFALILVSLFVIGLLCFLLPPVPGVPVYLFTGVIVAQTGPEAGFDFWEGVIISVSLCWVLKLAACAMQQKLIGEQLGRTELGFWIKQQVGVHKPVIRAIEAVLCEPGWTMGKVAILCGGPDWPTSVGAGLLRLSVFQMELGTVPIIVFLAPCTMCGSLYIKQDESEMWKRSAKLLFALTMFINLVFWAGAAWAVQEKLDRHYDALTRPMEAHLELDWRDYQEQEIARRCNLRWGDVPICLRYILAVGGISIVSVGQAFYWRSSWCFGNFEVTSDTSDLRWTGPSGMLRTPGIIGLLFSTVNLLTLVYFRRWLHVRQKGPAAQVSRELGAVEAAWKETRIIKAREAQCKLVADNGLGDS